MVVAVVAVMAVKTRVVEVAAVATDSRTVEAAAGVAVVVAAAAAAAVVVTTAAVVAMNPEVVEVAVEAEVAWGRCLTSQGVSLVGSVEDCMNLPEASP